MNNSHWHWFRPALVAVAILAVVFLSYQLWVTKTENITFIAQTENGPVTLRVENFNPFDEEARYQLAFYDLANLPCPPAATVCYPNRVTEVSYAPLFNHAIDRYTGARVTTHFINRAQIKVFFCYPAPAHTDICAGNPALVEAGNQAKNTAVLTFYRQDGVMDWRELDN